MASISLLLNTIKNAIYGRDMRSALHDSIKAVNDDVETRLSRNGGMMTGGITMGSNKITSSATPTVDNDYTNKKYVDAKDKEVASYNNSDYPECTNVKLALDKAFNIINEKAYKDEALILDMDGMVPDERLRNPIKNLKDGSATNSLKTPTARVISDSAVSLGKNSMAGAKVLEITSVTSNSAANTSELTVKLSALTEIELEMFDLLTAGEKCCIRTSNEFDNISIVSIDKANSKIVVDTVISAVKSGDEYANYICFIDYPELGNTYTKTPFGFSEGENTRAMARAAHSEGRDTKTIGQYGHSEGRLTMAGYAAHAEGYITNAVGNMSHAEGHITNANGGTSHAEGAETVADGDKSHAEGYRSAAQSLCSHAEGNQTVANGEGSHSEGIKTETENLAAHSEGHSTKATGIGSHSEGQLSEASGWASHAEGMKTIASGTEAHSEGVETKAVGSKSHAEGYQTTASGEYSHAEGRGTDGTGALGHGSHSEGYHTTARDSASHAEGSQTVAGGRHAHAEGNQSMATGEHSHAEGYDTIAEGRGSHSEGFATQALGNYSHAEGISAFAKGAYSHTEGNSTIAAGDYQHVQGKYNVKDDNNKYAHIVGNGMAYNERSNAHTIDWDGNAWFAGTLEGTAIILKSSVEGSSKRFKITVDDSGVLTAFEISD